MRDKTKNMKLDNYTLYNNWIQTKKYTLNLYKEQSDIKSDARLIQILIENMNDVMREGRRH